MTYSIHYIRFKNGVNEDHADINKAIDSGLIICDTVLDFVPVVGNIKNGTTRIADGFTKHTLSVRTESFLYFLFACILINECSFNAEFL